MESTLKIEVKTAGNIVAFCFQGKEDKELFKKILEGAGLLKMAKRVAEKVGKGMEFIMDLDPSLKKELEIEALERVRKSNPSDTWKAVVTEELPEALVVSIGCTHYLGAIKSDFISDIEYFLNRVSKSDPVVEKIADFLIDFIEKL